MGENGENKDKDVVDDNQEVVDTGSDNSGNGVKTYTQEEVNALLAKEKSAGQSDVYKKLGIDPTDEKVVAMFKAFVESQKTEADKQKEASDKQQAALIMAQERANIAEAKAEAMKLGAKAEFVEDVVTLALAKKTEDGDIKSVINELKTKYSVWFGASEDKGKDSDESTGDKGTGASVKPSGKGKSGGRAATGIGKRLAEKRLSSSSVKKSYWS